MTEVQKPRKVKELLKYPVDDYEIVVEINHEEHNLDFLVNGIRKKIIFFYEYGDGDDVLNELATKCSYLEKENEQLKAQLKKGEDVCSICKHEYLTPSGDYFIGKCEKGHEECSKEDIKYCEDFELKGEMNEV